MLSTSKIMKVVPASVIRTVSRQWLVARKNSPHIFFGLGIVGTITGTVLACRATLKLSETLDDIQDEIKTVKGLKNPDPDPEAMENYPAEAWTQDMAYVYTKSSIRLIRLYAPSVLIGGVSIGLITKSHIDLSRRNAALMAAYAAVQKAYDDYRERVKEEFGEAKELEIYHAARTENVIDKDGNKVKAKVADPNKYSPYAKFFDEYSEFWNKDPELNRLFVQCQQNYANNLLNARGHVFLNECYDMLGIERSSAGQVVGWVRNGEGDNYVDFGIFEAFNSAFVNGHERSILLDFNVDGVIWDKI